MAFEGDSVTFDGKMGPAFIRYSAAYPHPWVVCENTQIPARLPHPPALLLNFANNERKCSSVLFCGVGGRVTRLFSGIALELSSDYTWWLISLLVKG